MPKSTMPNITRVNYVKRRRRCVFIDMFWNIQHKKTLVTVAFPNKHSIPNQDYFIRVK